MTSSPQRGQRLRHRLPLLPIDKFPKLKRKELSSNRNSAWPDQNGQVSSEQQTVDRYVIYLLKGECKTLSPASGIFLRALHTTILGFDICKKTFKNALLQFCCGSMDFWGGME